MGYIRKRPTYRLIFQDPELEGLEVVAKSASVEAYQRIAELSSRQFATHVSPEDLVEADNLFRAFAAVLVEWNLEEANAKGKVLPVPATYEGLKAQDLPFVMQIILAWMNAVEGVFAPAVAEADLPMEALVP